MNFYAVRWRGCAELFSDDVAVGGGAVMGGAMDGGLRMKILARATHPAVGLKC
ncbi:hypothetical protein [Achromobacter insolitus]|uniref:hypothetical protein n=1 Tax=Achromobacter insolitus TaxID=217204 RepID=UPI001583438C|nr:hypothetical protein [Achromobacter insolitus]